MEEAALKILWLAINQVQEVSLMPRKLHHQLSDNYLIPILLPVQYISLFYFHIHHDSNSEYRPKNNAVKEFLSFLIFDVLNA